MKKSLSILLPASLAVSSMFSSTGVVAAETLVDAIKNGKVGLDFRLRYEDVDQAVIAAPDRDATAITLKTRLNLLTDDYKGFKAFVEFDDTTALKDDYNSTTNGKVSKSVVIDPEGSEVNQVWLAYSGIPETTLKWGRQRILLDNQRFVGGVGFRQNEQTYDAFSVSNTALPDTTIFVAHISNVNRIFGESSPGGDHDNSTHLFNVAYGGWDAGKLSLYVYDINNDDAAAFSSKTGGMRFAGTTGMFSYAAEYAKQSDAHNNPASYDASYYLLEGGVSVEGISVSLGREKLGTDGVKGRFITPLATLHKFQGWTDQFLGGGSGNIAGGIVDDYLLLKGKFMGVAWLTNYHQFEYDSATAAASAKSDIGSEWGVSLTRKFENYSLSLKYADYDADAFSTDTQKLWLTASASF